MMTGDALTAPTSRSGVGSGLLEIIETLTHWRLWGLIAVDDIVGRYRRTKLGPLWITAGQAGFIGGLYLLRARFSAGNPNYLEFLAASLPSWGLLVASLVDGSGALLRAKGLIESYPLPLALYSIRVVAAGFINYLHLMIVFVVVSLVQMRLPGPAVVAVIPGLIIALAFGLGAALMCAPLGARFHDLSPALTLATSTLFVLTPVFWVPSPGQLASPLVALNPFYYLLEVIRAPLLGIWPSPLVWACAGGIALVTLALGAVVYSRMREEIVYWL